ncbi:hypothetical protein J6590_017402 [Homalodisca vitripennis]|nr:hypothetical protein J6590_017402 [Homalodisca vitripennis]
MASCPKLTDQEVQPSLCNPKEEQFFDRLPNSRATVGLQQGHRAIVVLEWTSYCVSPGNHAIQSIVVGGGSTDRQHVPHHPSPPPPRQHHNASLV